MAWTWRYETSDGTAVATLPDVAQTSGFPSQSDAESWIGETWPALLAGGVDQVTLFEDEREVYGPMSLHPAQ
jgi:hypothetical protein